MMMNRILLSPPDIRTPEHEQLVEALESGWCAPVGPHLDSFEGQLMECCGGLEAVAVTSGTAALHLALLLLSIGPGDDVLAPTLTFVATANPIIYCAARPCFLDVDPHTWNLSSELLAQELQARRSSGRLPAAVISVDLYGQCAAYDELLPICQEYGVPLIEDAAEALGATWIGNPAGSFGELGVLSFNGNKIITASSGGALLCKSPEDAERARYLATQARQPTPHYEHTEVGYNYRLSNLLAAVGLGQALTLDERIERRRQIRQRYIDELSDLPGVSVHLEDPRGRSNAWLSCITLQPGVARRSPEELRRHLDADDIEARPIWKPMHLQPVFASYPSRLDGTAEQLFSTGLCLPSGSSMSEDDQARVIASIHRALGR